LLPLPRSALLELPSALADPSPQAATMVFDAEVKVVMVPLNITHTNLFTSEDNDRLVQAVPSSPFSTGARTPLRHTLSTLLNFFKETCSFFYSSSRVCKRY